MTSGSRRGDYAKAVALMIAGFSIVPGMDAIAKYLSAELPVVQIAWARFVFHLAFVLPIVLVRHRSVLWPRRPWLQLSRGAFQMTATILFFAAIARMPIADGLALLFSYPLIVTAFSPLLLGERVRRTQWMGVALGLVGVLSIVRPGFGMFQIAGVFALGAGGCFAMYVIATRKVAGSSPPLVTLVYSAIVGAAVLTLAAPSFWVAPHSSHWVLLVVIGFLAALGHLLIVKAFELAPASRIAPFGYFEIVAATMLGFFVFDDLPDLWTVCGMVVIVAAGLLVSYSTRSDAM
jgi:drug/metabolite transporter (DMT)-like permease